MFCFGKLWHVLILDNSSSDSCFLIEVTDRGMCAETIVKNSKQGARMIDEADLMEHLRRFVETC